MFWNKKPNAQLPVVNTALQHLKDQMDEIDRIYKDPQNAGHEVGIDMYQDRE